MAAQRAPEERLLKLTAWLLTRREPVSFDDIRAEFPAEYGGSAGAVDRKWTRDKQALQAAGVPIQFVEADGEHEAGYVLDPRAYYLPDLGLAPEELAVLWAAGQAAANLAGEQWREDLQSALRKLRCVGEPSPRPAVPFVYHGRAPQGGGSAEHLDALGDAIRRRKRVRLRYFTASRREQTERDVDVYGVAWRRGFWLFVGRCHLRNALRVFYLGRVVALRVNAKDPTRPDYEVPGDFDLRGFARQQPWDYWFGEPRRARVRLGGPLAALGAMLLPGAVLERDEAGGAIASVEVRDLDALVRQVLAWGPDAELLEPVEGRERARRMLEELGAAEVRP